MEQRPLRLGDVVDDYCPRERRVTNHAIVAIVEDVIRQTRCTTCDAEHPYKGAREPRLRRKPGTAALDDQVLADVTGAPPDPSPPEPLPEAAMEATPDATDETPSDVPAQATEGGVVDEEPPAGVWIMHRQLIRATLPRADNDQPPPRPIPEFTMHQRHSRGSRAFRFHGQGTGNHNANGNVNGNVNGNTGGRGHGFGGQGGNRHGKHSGRRHRGGKRPR
jgi:hypothetical protein